MKNFLRPSTHTVVLTAGAILGTYSASWGSSSVGAMLIVFGGIVWILDTCVKDFRKEDNNNKKEDGAVANLYAAMSVDHANSAAHLEDIVKSLQTLQASMEVILPVVAKTQDLYNKQENG